MSTVRTAAVPRFRAARAIAFGVAAAAVACAARVVPEAVAREAATGPRVGLFMVDDGRNVDDALAGIREAFRRSGDEPVFLERETADDEAEARTALNWFAFERVEVVLAVGPTAATFARDALSEQTVVFTAVQHPTALGLPGRGNVCGTAGGVSAMTFASVLRRTAPRADRVRVALTGDDVQTPAFIDEIVAAQLSPAMTFDDRALEGETPQERAATFLEDVGDVDVVWLSPDVSAEDARAIAERLAETGIPLVGSAGERHLHAGCAVVVNTDTQALAQHAVVLARRALAGEAPSEIGVHEPTGHVLQVHLDAARRLGWEPPITLIAAADRVVPSTWRSR